MSKRTLEKLIPKAMDAVSDNLLKDKTWVASEYNGYIASMGASIIQAGLLPTIAVFADKGSGAQQDKRQLLKAIHQMLDEPKGDDLLSHTISLQNDRNKLRQLKKQIIERSVALKLAIRTFENKKTNKQDD